MVGLGVVLLSRVNARSVAEDSLQEQLETSANLLALNPNRRGFPLDRIKNLAGLRQLNVVAVTQDGIVKPFEGEQADFEIQPLSESEFDELSEKNFLILNHRSVKENGKELESQVAGINLIEVSWPRDQQDPGLIYGIYGSQNSGQFDRDILVLFILSSFIVLLLSGFAAVLLAKKFSKPVSEIEKVTNLISSGELDARVDARGPAEIESLGKSVNKMAEDLQRSKDLDRQFLLSVSHDLRTPLTVIKGYGEALAEGAADNPLAVGQIITSNSLRLERLVQDLLDLARLDANQFTFHPVKFDFSKKVSGIVDGFGQRATENGISLDYTDSGVYSVTLDPVRTSQVITNLVENALKYTKSLVQVQVASDGSNLLMTVTDDGPGISNEEIEKIFDRFYISNKNPEEAGNSIGMGLAISKELALAMNGDIKVESKLGSGTIMSFLVPYV